MAAEHWFRWHHGTVNDPKWRVVANRASHALSRDVTVCHVVSVWACMLECASQATPRGTLDGWDDEDIAAGLGLDTEMVAAIREGMEGKVLEGDALSAWNVRQPKSEDATATERKRAQRAREREAKQPPEITQSHAASRDVTECHDRDRDRYISPSLRSGDTPRKRAATPDRPDDVDETTWRDWLALRRAKRAPVTDTVLAQARREATKAGLTLTRFLEIWCARGSQGLQAEWLRPNERNGPPARPAHSGATSKTAMALMALEDFANGGSAGLVDGGNFQGVAAADVPGAGADPGSRGDPVDGSRVVRIAQAGAGLGPRSGHRAIA